MKNLLALAVFVLFSIYTRAQSYATCADVTTFVSVNSNTCVTVNGDLYNANAPATTLGGCSGLSKDTWFKFTTPANTGAVRLTPTITSGSSPLNTNNTYFEIFSGTCPTGLTSRGCYNFGGTRAFGGLTGSTTYFVRVYSTTTNNLVSSGTNAYKFNICITANDACAMAIPIVPGNTATGSLRGANATSGLGTSCTGAGNPDDDVWYSFAAAETFATVMVSNQASELINAGARVQILKGSCGSFTSVACGANAVNATGLNVGEIYYARVYSDPANPQVSGGANSWDFQVSVFPSAKSNVVAGRMNEVYQTQILSSPQALLDPWEVIYGPDDNLWVTEAKGYRVYRINPTTGVRDTILDISQNATFLPLADRTFNCTFGNGTGAQGGMAGMVLHPKFLKAGDEVNWVYIAYVHSRTDGQHFTNRVVRFEYDKVSKRLHTPISVCDTLPGSNDHNSQRLAIAPVGTKDYLFYASGDMGAGQFDNKMRLNYSQDIGSYEGKILRFNLDMDTDGAALDKWIPSGATTDERNPYSATLGKQSAVWAIGIRNNQGFAWDPVLKKLYGSSHGPFSDDEINVIERDKNYGHPIVIGYAEGNANGTTAGASPFMSSPHPSSCPIITDEVAAAAAIPNYKDPFFSAYASSPVWGTLKNLWDNTTNANGDWPSEGWSGLDFYSNTVVPGWNRSLVAASLKWGRLVRIKANASGEGSITGTPGDTISYFGSTNRFRDLAFTPDGKDIFVVMDRSISTSGPSALNPIITACQGCLQKYTFLGYNNNSGRSTLPTSIQVSAGTANTCNTSSSVGINSSNNTLWVPITGPDGDIVAEILSNGQNLGNINASFYRHSGTIRSFFGAKYLNRSITINPQVAPSSTVRVRLYISKAEFDALDADPLSSITTLSDLKVYKNSNPCQAGLTGSATVVTPVYAEAHGANTYVIAVDITGFSTFYFAAANSVLPIDLNFSGIFKNQTTYLTWKTENERNTDRFVVERSINNSTYEAIGTVAAKGASGTKVEYNFEDKDAAKLGVDKVYYRLKIVDRDDAQAYSNIVTINIGANGTSTVSVYPNPTDQYTTVVINSSMEQSIKWKLVDASGRVLQSKQINLRKGENRINLDLNSYKSGVYYLQLNGAFINKLEKIQKL